MLSRIYIAHVRHKTIGGPPTHADTHPFLREFLGRDYFFAHNGTLKDLNAECPLDRYHPVGGTDSEYAFCCILGEIVRRGSHLNSAADYDFLHEQLAKLNHRGQLNCLISDGSSLMCYHDMNGYKGLSWRKLDGAGREPGHFEDGEMQMAIESSVDNRGYIAATHSLGGENWHSFQPGQLMVFREGALAYSSCPMPASAVRAG